MKPMLRLKEELVSHAKNLARRIGETFTKSIEVAIGELLSRPAKAAGSSSAILPMYGSPRRSMTLTQLKRAIEDADDEKGLGNCTDDSSRPSR